MIEVKDQNGKEIAVGTKVLWGGLHIAYVSKITEPETDYDDQARGPVTYLGRVYFIFKGEDEEDYVIIYDDGDGNLTIDDIEVIE